MNDNNFVKNAALQIYLAILEHPEIALTSYKEMRGQIGAREEVADYSVRLAEGLEKAFNKKLNEKLE